MKKKIALIGSTGSIGRQVLDVVRENPDFSVVSLVANVNKELLQKQIIEFNPEVACLTGLSGGLSAPKGTKVFYWANSALEAVTKNADIVFVSVT